MPGHFDFLGRAEGCFFEGQFEVVTKIGAAMNPISGSSTSPAKEVAETEDVTKDVAEICEDVRIKSAGTTTDTLMAEPIVTCSFLRIAQNGIRFGSFLELFFSLCISGIAIGMVLERQLSICAFDFL